MASLTMRQFRTEVHMIAASRFIALCVLLVGWSAVQPAMAANNSRQHIAPQPLSGALEAWAKQYSVQLIFGADLTDGRRSPGAAAGASREQALAQILAGSGLTFKWLNDRTVAIRRSLDSDAHALDAAADRMRLAQVSKPTSGSKERLPSASESGAKETEVVVTGTHIRGIAPDSAPVTVYTRKDIEDSGRTSVEQFLRIIPQNSQSGVNQENINATGTGQLISEHGAGVNLRGLGQRATLVLVNGKRLAPAGNGSFVDVSLIPISALERIEILTDGASAIYGSDAVGGVINFILKGDFDGFETALTAGSATRGDGDLLQVAQTLGHQWNGGNALLAYEYRDQDEILAQDRPFAIGVPPTSFFLPRERRHSLLFSGRQELTANALFGIAATYGTRLHKRDYFSSSLPLIFSDEGDADNLSVSADLNYRLPREWNFQLTGIHSKSQGLLTTVYTETNEVLTKLYTDNAMREFGAKLDGPVWAIAGGEIRIAFGGAVRNEDHSTVSTVNRGSRNVKDQQVRALFVEAVIPFVSGANARPGLRRLELNAAARAEDYSEYGSTTNPRIGVLWSPLPGLNVRGSYSTSFRAPLLNEATGIYSVIYSRETTIYLNPAQSIGLPVALSGTNPTLTPETSRSWTGGFDYSFSAIAGLKITANYFTTEFTDRIARPSTSLRVVGNPAFDSIVTRNPALADVNAAIAGAVSIVNNTGTTVRPEDVRLILDIRTANTARTDAEGVDFTVDYRRSFGEHRVGLSANATYLMSFEDQLTPTSVPLETLDTLYNSLRLRARGGVTWGYSGWGVNLFVNYADDYKDPGVVPVARIGSDLTFDLGGSYSFGDSAPSWLRASRLSLSALNVLDRFPPAVGRTSTAGRGPGYDPVNATARGRFISLELNKRW